MTTIDFHLHLFSRTYFEALAGLSPLPGSVEERLASVAMRAGIELPPASLEEHVRRWVASFDEHQVARAAAFASLPEEIPVLTLAASLSRGRLVPFALVNPTLLGCAERVRRLILDHGFRGVILFPALHHYHVGQSECQELFQVLDQHRAVAFVHCGALVVPLRDLLGLPRVADLRYASPLDVIPVANAHPSASFVIPHFGAGFLRETLLAGAQCENVHVDTSSSNGWLAYEPSGIDLERVFERALGVFGPRRILFGTDSGTFPKGWRSERRDQQAAILERLGVADSERRAIFHDNAAELLSRRA